MSFTQPRFYFFYVSFEEQFRFSVSAWIVRVISPFWPPAGEVSEAALVRDILYVFQGIDGKFIKMSAQENCYKIDGKVPARARVPVKLLIEIWLQ